MTAGPFAPGRNSLPASRTKERRARDMITARAAARSAGRGAAGFTTGRTHCWPTHQRTATGAAVTAASCRHQHHCRRHECEQMAQTHKRFSCSRRRRTRPGATILKIARRSPKETVQRTIRHREYAPLVRPGNGRDERKYQNLVLARYPEATVTEATIVFRTILGS